MSSQESESESSPTPYYGSFNSGGQYGAKSSSSDEDASSDNDSEQHRKQLADISRKHAGDHGPPPSSKRAKLGDSMPTYSVYYSEQSRKMMDLMNFDKSKGLGKSGQGRRDIVQIAPQKGRRGLGKSDLFALVFFF